MTVYVDYNRICWRCDKRWESVPRQADWIDIMECRVCREKGTVTINKKKGMTYALRPKEPSCETHPKIIEI